jgi:hypothetical protein
MVEMEKSKIKGQKSKLVCQSDPSLEGEESALTPFSTVVILGKPKNPFFIRHSRGNGNPVDASSDPILSGCCAVLVFLYILAYAAEINL